MFMKERVNIGFVWRYILCGKICFGGLNKFASCQNNEPTRNISSSKFNKLFSICSCNIFKKK